MTAESEYSEARLSTRCELNACLRRDHAIWWSRYALGMEHAAVMRNSYKLLHFIRATYKKTLAVSETILGTDGSSVHNQQRRLMSWAEHLKAQFIWPLASGPLIEIPAHSAVCFSRITF